MLQHAHQDPVRPSRVVVLGSSGFIGSHLLEHLAASGVDRLGVSRADVDLAEPAAADALKARTTKDDTVVLISCLTRDKGESLAVFMRNLAMAQSVGALLETRGVKHLVYLSSDAVYPDALALAREDSPLGPGGLYGQAHVAREAMLAYSAAKAGVPLAILRPCAVFGPGDTHNGYGPNRFLRTAEKDGKIALFGGGEETREHVFVDDVCRLIGLCAAHGDTGVVNVAPGRGHTFAQVAEAAAQAAARPVAIEPSPRRSPITHRRYDVSALLKAYPSFAFTSLEEGLKRMAGQAAAAR
ncbi:MAG: NAD-dependent epimerase/dehydratase family protein [Elusimicrobia bacterium]|nr:NAD-dependent epimerase/dehydratase family protein [Elusimicrobiota bacterium]